MEPHQLGEGVVGLTLKLQQQADLVLASQEQLQVALVYLVQKQKVRWQVLNQLQTPDHQQHLYKSNHIIIFRQM